MLFNLDLKYMLKGVKWDFLVKGNHKNKYNKTPDTLGNISMPPLNYFRQTCETKSN